MTRAERILVFVVLVGIAGALVLPPAVVELAIAAQVAILGVIALGAGLYIKRVNQGLTRRVSEYLWLLVRRDLRVTLGLALLGLLALASLLPRLLMADPIVSRPWGVVWLVIAIDLFAVGLIDDALTMRADTSIGSSGPVEPEGGA